MSTSVEVPPNPSAVQITTAPPPEVDVAAPELPRGRRFQDLCMVLLVALWYPMLGTLYYLRTGARVSAGDPKTYLTAGFSFEAVGLAMLLYVLHRQGRSLRAIGLRLIPPDFFRGLGLWVLAYVAAIVVGSLMRVVAPSLGINPVGKDVAALVGLKQSSGWLAFMLFNPWYEELIVRAYAMTEIEALTGKKWIAVAASVGLQAAYHAYQGIFNVILVATSFLVFAIYFSRKHLALPIVIAHMMEDLFALALVR